MSLNVAVFSCILLVTAAERVHPGSRELEVPTRDGRIIGGSVAEPHEFPHIVSLDKDPTPSHFCGGAIIDKNWVLTAGHCIAFADGQTFRIKAGKHSLKTVEDNEQVINVEKYFIHEKYKGKKSVGPHDIALLKLEKPLVFNEYVHSIAPPVKNSEVTGKVTLSGWGKIEYDRSPDKLRKAEFSIIDFDTCQKADINIWGAPSAVAETNICTDSSDGHFACTGDSGSPLIQKQNGTNTLVGIFSWLSSPCGRKGAPSVFTKVSLYLDWISDIIAKNSL